MTAGAVSAMPPFSGATGVRALGGGRYEAELGQLWAVGPKAHGGLLLVLMARAGLAELEGDLDPLAVSADFLRAPDLGTVEIATEVLKRGRTASVVSVRMEQAGKLMLSATVTAGKLTDDDPVWADLPGLPAEPPADAIVATGTASGDGLGNACDLRFDRETSTFTRGEHGPPLLRGWARTRDEPVDALFALLAGDVLAPTVFNLTGRFGWAPTVQLTALLRARPAPGWLRLESRTTAVAGGWFDEDVSVIDASGRLVCQARQLALAPAGR